MISNMKLATSNQIKRIDKLSTSKYNIPSQIRMEIAGIKSYEIVKREYAPRNTLIVIGTGNNGGDGLVLARYLKLNGYKCSILITKTSKIQSGDFKSNLLMIKKLKIQTIKDLKKVRFKDYDLIIDGIFGVGLNRPLNNKILDLVKRLNKESTPICSLDLPSGLNPDNGKTYSGSIVADTTITYDFAKPGLVTDPGAKFSKKVFIVSLQIYWSDMVLVLAIVSILIGSVVAIVQTNIKRLLAYSTIANVGFILLGIYTGPNSGFN